MSFKKRLFAWLLTKGDAVNQRVYRSYKEKLFRNLGSVVVEIGPGAGGNLEYLFSGVKWFGIEPNETFHRALLRRADEKGIQATLFSTKAENIPLPDNHADSIICTLVLCSVSSPSTVIFEMKRIVKPGGRLFFIEHVAAPQKTFLRTAQNIFNPLNRIIADGCHCNRETWEEIQKAGFSHVELSHHRINGMLKLHSPHIMGYAVK